MERSSHQRPALLLALCLFAISCGGEGRVTTTSDAEVDAPLDFQDAGYALTDDAGLVADANAADIGRLDLGETDAGIDGSSEIDTGVADAGSDSEPDANVELPPASQVEAITFNWPARYGPSPGVDSEDRLLWSALSQRASVMALQEAGWIAGYIRRQGWEVHRPNPPGDGDDQPVGNFLVWDPDVWRVQAKGAFLLSPRTRIQPEAAGPTYHRTKYLVWARLKNRRNGAEWNFASIHFVPSKHLGGAALQLWKLQRDNLLTWWGRRNDWTVVMGDFNAQPGDNVAQPIWNVAQRQTAPSHGNREIDWIVRKPALSGAGVRALDNRGQSDHRPVRGVVRWEP